MKNNFDMKNNYYICAGNALPEGNVIPQNDVVICFPNVSHLQKPDKEICTAFLFPYFCYKYHLSKKISTIKNSFET